MNKNDELELEIVDNGMEFEGIAKENSTVIFVPGAIKGERVKAKIIKVNKKFCIAKVEDIVRKSIFRVEPECKVYKRCGGCSAQHISYDAQLMLKKKILKNTLDKQYVHYPKINDVIGMGVPYYYRNKAQYPVRNVKGENKIGFYAKKSHDIIENDYCMIQNMEIDKLSKDIFKLLMLKGFTGYNEETNTGDIRHLLLRRGYNTSEIMVVIVVNNKEMLEDVRIEEIVDILVNENSSIKTIILNYNNSKTNEILGDDEKIVYGDGYITDYIGKYMYYISSKSFFQVNTVQAEMLYNVLKNNLNLAGDEVFFDLYSGVGSIGIFLSDSVKKVYGIEIEEQAVKMANMNIEENDIKNAEYIAGSVENKIIEYENRNIKPDVIVVDPPRKGLALESIDYILKFAPKKIGYVSCNPATLARDLKLLEQYYKIKSITPVDMFPQSHHIETVCVLERNK